MKRILFVDDEPNVLRGLKRMLRSQRRQWEMLFVGSGREALELMGKQPIDVVVSDMRMPVMDGAEFLSLVRKQYPQIVRIILSGDADQLAIMKSVRPAHQYLAKPCDATTVITVLKRACALGDLLANEYLVSLVSNIETLPPFPEHLQTLMESLESDESSLDQIGQIISEDMGMSATILKVVNSAFFGFAQNISSPSHAVRLLGLDVIKALVITHHMFETFDFSQVQGFSYSGLWRHSMAVSGFAKRIAQSEAMTRTKIDDVFISGLLHDVGKLILGSSAPGEYNRILEVVREKNQPVWETEFEVLGVTHAQVGGYLLGLWGLSQDVVDAVSFHHNPDEFFQEGPFALTAVHVGDVFEHELCIINQNYARPQLGRFVTQDDALKAKLPQWLALCREDGGCVGDDLR